MLHPSIDALILMVETVINFVDTRMAMLSVVLRQTGFQPARKSPAPIPRKSKREFFKPGIADACWDSFLLSVNRNHVVSRGSSLAFESPRLPTA